MITIITWDEALVVLHQILPNCDKLLPDAITDAADAAGVPVQLVPVEDWEMRPDREIFQEIMPAAIDVAEHLVVVTDFCFWKGIGPFQLTGGDFANFVDSHLAHYGVCAVDGDVIVLIPSRKLIVLFHHEGFHGTVVCK